MYGGRDKITWWPQFKASITFVVRESILNLDSSHLLAAGKRSCQISLSYSQSMNLKTMNCRTTNIILV